MGAGIVRRPVAENDMQSSESEITFDIHLQPGESFSLPTDVASAVGPGHWLVSIRPADEALQQRSVRRHAAFLNSYVPQDEGLYDDYSAG